MLVGRVTGNVVSTNKCDSLWGAKLLIVQPVDLETLQMKDDYVICVDDVGAGEGDLADYHHQLHAGAYHAGRPDHLSDWRRGILLPAG